ncbi:hypothetical protein BGZ46_010447 [Entomortierella lignicola]|nr:hypothetical protein BGZ46_010447 [Entomortierella lignicola]
MNDLEMDEAFDFKALSLDEPEDRLTKAFEESFHVGINQEQQQKQTVSSSAIPHSARESLAETFPANSESGDETTSTTETPDNGPWAKIPTGSENPFQPGITAEKLDAMAIDPNHVFKSSQTPNPFPFTEIPQASTSKAGSEFNGATRGTETSSFNEKIKAEPSGLPAQDDQDKVPAWMLADPELTPQPGWGPRDATGPTFTSQDFTLDWSSNADHSTAVDSNVLFGFSSYPTYESLSISNVIADEQYKRIGNGFEASSSELEQGGFAKYGSQDTGGAQTFGYRGSTNDHQISATATNPSLTDSQQWQNWRSGPNQDHKIDFDLDFDALDESPKIK